MGNFSDQSVGLTGVYAQLRTKTLPNTTAASGANIRANGFAPFVAVAAANTIQVRAIIANRGSLGGTPARISVYVSAGVGRPNAAGPTFTTGTPLLSLWGLLENAGVPALAPSACVEILPDPTTGAIDVTFTFTGDCTVRVSLAAGEDFISESLSLT